MFVGGRRLPGQRGQRRRARRLLRRGRCFALRDGLEPVQQAPSPLGRVDGGEARHVNARVQQVSGHACRQQGLGHLRSAHSGRQRLPRPGTILGRCFQVENHAGEYSWPRRACSGFRLLSPSAASSPT